MSDPVGTSRPRSPAAALAQPGEGGREAADKTPIMRTKLSAPSLQGTSLALTPARRGLLFVGKLFCPLSLAPGTWETLPCKGLWLVSSWFCDQT